MTRLCRDTCEEENPSEKDIPSEKEKFSGAAPLSGKGIPEERSNSGTGTSAAETSFRGRESRKCETLPERELSLCEFLRSRVSRRQKIPYRKWSEIVVFKVHSLLYESVEVIINEVARLCESLRQMNIKSASREYEISLQGRSPGRADRAADEAHVF